jgi:hypothetical protein
MKPLPLKVDNYIFERITEEAKAKKVTKAEVVRSALVHYLLNRNDIADVTLIQNRLTEPDVPAHKVHTRLAKNH